VSKKFGIRLLKTVLVFLFQNSQAVTSFKCFVTGSTTFRNQNWKHLSVMIWTTKRFRQNVVSTSLYFLYIRRFSISMSSSDERGMV